LNASYQVFNRPRNNQTRNLISMANDSKDFLYVSDLDGTLLTPDSYLSLEAIDRLNKLLSLGLNFTIATARNYDSVRPILKGLDLKIPVILFNGVYLTDFHTGENILTSRHLPKTAVIKIIEEASRENIDPFVYTFDKTHNVYYRNVTNPGSQNYVDYINKISNENRLKHIKDYEFLSEMTIPGLLFIDTYLKLAPLHEKIQALQNAGLNVYFAEDIAVAGHFWLQVFDGQANKGNMLKQLAHRLDTPLEETVVFGDYLNDLEMFEIAGRSIAMGNALKEVKDSADLIIGSNADLAVINYLEKVGFK
jgi:5-amino-6-(5-phospho-D-ribitylamino)uracil phosphatase